MTRRALTPRAETTGVAPEYRRRAKGDPSWDVTYTRTDGTQGTETTVAKTADRAEENMRYLYGGHSHKATRRKDD